MLAHAARIDQFRNREAAAQLDIFACLAVADERTAERERIAAALDRYAGRVARYDPTDAERINQLAAAVRADTVDTLA